MQTLRASVIEQFVDAFETQCFRTGTGSDSIRIEAICLRDLRKRESRA